MGQLQVNLVKKMIKIDRCFGFEGPANKIILRSKQQRKKETKMKNSVTFQETITITSQTHSSLFYHHSKSTQTTKLALNIMLTIHLCTL